MAEEELVIVRLEENYPRDGLRKIIIIIASVFFAISLVIGTSIYLYVSKPPPITFMAYPEWRVQPEVPLIQPYLSITDLLQWVSDVMPKVFTYDFISYQDQQDRAQNYFTTSGWQIFSNYLKNYADYNNVQKYKQFIRAVPTGAPILLNQGILSGRYAWWVQIPIQLSYEGLSSQASKNLTFQVLVVRVTTLNNLSGVGIENIILSNK